MEMVACISCDGFCSEHQEGWICYTVAPEVRFGYKFALNVLTHPKSIRNVYEFIS